MFDPAVVEKVVPFQIFMFAPAIVVVLLVIVPVIEFSLQISLVPSPTSDQVERLTAAEATPPLKRPIV
jgi:hypothetical protein